MRKDSHVGQGQGAPKGKSRRIFLKGVGAAGLLAAAQPLRSRPAKAAGKAPFFKLYMMIPNNQPPRMVWGTLAAQQIQKLNIEVVTSFVPFSVIIPRRTEGKGKTHVEGGWDSYLERFYYYTLLPVPNTLFHSSVIPPNGMNYYYIEDPVIDKALDDYAGAMTEAKHIDAIRRFEKRWYDYQHMLILFYPQDVIAINPKLKGFDGTTFTPVYFPRPENWTIEGAGDNASAAFASWQPPEQLLPMNGTGYNQSNVYGPVYDTLLQYDSWEKKNLVPALCESYTMSGNGKHWVLTLRQGVKWHSGEEFTARERQVVLGYDL